jgi:hypothetical protein
VDYNRIGGKNDEASPLRQPVVGFDNALLQLFSLPKFVGLCEFDKSELDIHPTLLVQVRNIGWYVEDEKGVHISDDDSNVFVIMKDTLPDSQDIKNLTDAQHVDLGVRLSETLERAGERELATLQFRILVRQPRNVDTSKN